MALAFHKRYILRHIVQNAEVNTDYNLQFSFPYMLQVHEIKIPAQICQTPAENKKVRKQVTFGSLSKK